MSDCDDLRQALIQEHRKAVAEWSGNFGGHVGIREGWVNYDEDTEIEACGVCDLLLRTAPLVPGEWHDGDDPIPGNVTVETEWDPPIHELSWEGPTRSRLVRWRQLR